MADTAKQFDDGGPAFGHGNHEQGGHSGMSLRDWFAGLAMSGMLGGVPGSHLRPLADGIGKEAYDVADALLAARKAGA